MESNIASFEEELVTDWLKNMENSEWQYKEPILDSETIGVLRNACTTLQQDIHVFVNSVEILEDYIRKNNDLRHKIDDPILTVAAVITISSKNSGDQDLKLNHVQNLLNRLTGRVYTVRDVFLKEINILKTLDNKLAIETVVDDLKTLTAKFEYESKIKVSILPLCLDILEMMYLTRKDWFFEFKEIYCVSEEALFIFEKLMCSRFFLPSAIIVFTLNQTAYRDSLNITMIMRELAALSKVHCDHLQGLVRQMKQVFQKHKYTSYV